MNLSFRCLRSALFAVAGSLALASCVTTPAPRGAAPAVPPPLAEVAPVAAPEPEPEPETPPIEVSPIVAEALAALDRHAGQVAHRDRIGVVDFSLPSSEPRFYIVDVASGRIERSLLVAHGSGSDPAGTGTVQRFSNAPGSNASSQGAYLTANAYVGQHGPSRRLVGLDATNDRALDRAIVIHGADYVDPALIPRQGRIGRSQGCFAFEPGEVATVLELLGEGRLIYAGRPENG